MWRQHLLCALRTRGARLGVPQLNSMCLQPWAGQGGWSLPELGTSPPRNAAPLPRPGGQARTECALSAPASCLNGKIPFPCSVRKIKILLKIIFKRGEGPRRQSQGMLQGSHHPNRPTHTPQPAHRCLCQWHPKMPEHLQPLPAQASLAASCSPEVTGTPWQPDPAQAVALPSPSFRSLGRCWAPAGAGHARCRTGRHRAGSCRHSRLCHTDYANQMQDNYLHLFDTRGTSRT